MSAIHLHSGPQWLKALRAAGAARFAEAGLPTQRQEAWKYTSLNALRKFGFEPTPPATPTSPVAVPPALLDGPAYRLVFVGGRFDAARSSIGGLPDGVVLGGLADLVRRSPDLLRAHLGRRAVIDRRPMVALNAAWIEDGLVLIVPRGVALTQPVEVTFLSAGAGAETSYPRHAISLGDNAEATIVERHVDGGSGGFTNAVAEIDLGRGATLRHYALHQAPDAALSVDTLVARLDRDSRYAGFALLAGGGLVRRDVEIALAGAGASAQVDGAYLVDGDRHADSTILIDHQAPHCTSRQVQKGVVDDHGRAVFQGKILVRPNAQKTDGHQLNQTLLLSPDAEMDTKPELEIHADDVKCSHGATIGRLDQDALFFLRARGIPKVEARALLIEGFVGGALDEIDHEAVRDAFKAFAVGRLAVFRTAEGTE